MNGSRTTKQGRKKQGKTGTMPRRADVTRARADRDWSIWRQWVNRPSSFANLVIMICVILVLSFILIWSRSQAYYSEDQIMDRTLVARTDFEVIDKGATNARRDEARKQAPRVYHESGDAIESLRQALLGLPRVVHGKSTIAEVDRSIITTFGLTRDGLTALQNYVDADGEPTEDWVTLVDDFVVYVVRVRPVIDTGRWQREMTLLKVPIRLEYSDRTTATVRVGDLLDVQGDWPESLRTDLLGNLPTELQRIFESPWREDARPTFQFAEAATNEAARAAAESIPTLHAQYTAGDVLCRRADRLTADQVELLSIENARYLASLTLPHRWGLRLAMVALVSILVGAAGWFLVRFHPTALARPRHVIGLAVLTSAALAVSVAASIAMPQVMLLTILAPAILVAIAVHVGFGSALAVGISVSYGVLLGLAFDHPTAAWLMAMIGSVVAIAGLPEIRDRNTLVRAGAKTGVVMGLAAVLLALWNTPNAEPLWYWRSAMVDGLYAASAGLLVGLFALGVLSTIERTFDVTTGLTLVELRDPKHPLLQELHQRAPGTWNHSLQVANIAESAAQAIGADSLLTYVGSLYHDIGKMNKPQYFVENQSGGHNRHEKLSPTMSLLLIVGHVKDGIEMARDWALAKPIHHFIEAHHGTTLVEYFYHMAKERAQAEHGDDEDVSEVSYRYPGPKPQTREVAIVMLADASESASRTLPEFSPTRVEQLVRSIGQKRLLDHQFDDCNLTLRELRKIEDSITKSICALRHARVSYPSEKEEEGENGASESPMTSAATVRSKTATAG